MPHVIRPTQDRLVVRPDFGIRIEGDEDVFAPKELCERLQARYPALTIEQFLSFVFSFPSAVAALLGADVQDVLVARDSLSRKLKGVVADRYLQTPVPVQRKYGALNPAGVVGPEEV